MCVNGQEYFHQSPDLFVHISRKIFLFDSGPCTNGSVTLLQDSGSLNATSGGVVRLCFDNKPFLVCDNGWDFADSRVLCQSVGYSPYGTC